MVTKTTFKKKFPDVKVQKLQTSVVYGKVMSDKPFAICGELCIRVDFGGMPENGVYSCVCFVM